MEPAGQTRVERRLAAILAADVAGYSRLIEADEEGTLCRHKALRAEIVDPKIVGHRGRIVKTTGDGLLVEFASVVDAVRCAAGLQAGLAERNAAFPAERRIDFRIGIHQGDVVFDDGDVFGDGVNIAARLEGLAEPGGICVSARVREDATGRLDLAFEDIGDQQLKNITRPVRVFRVRSPLPNPPALAGERRVVALPLPDKPSIAVLPFVISAPRCVSARARAGWSHAARRCVFHHSALRTGGVGAAPGGPGESKLAAGVSLSCRLLGSYASTRPVKSSPVCAALLLK